VASMTSLSMMAAVTPPQCGCWDELSAGIAADREVATRFRPWQNGFTFIQPLISTVFNVGWTGDNSAQPTNQVTNILEQGKAALADPKRLAAYLVTTDDPVAAATARYFG